MNENWKDVIGYEGLYQVSNLGRVKSLNRFVTRGCNSVFRTGNVLKSSITKDYLKVVLSKDANKKTFTIHQLMAIAFLNHKVDGHKLVVDHIDSNKTNNRLENLQIVSQRENVSKSNKLKTSKYIGVFWCKSKNKWVSRITINNKRFFLGSFNCELTAHLAYQNKLKTI
jgi:hypothetical protein